MGQVKLSAADQQLLNTEFAPEIEKEAEAMVKMANDCYARGCEMAVEIADNMDKLAEEEEKKEDKDEKMDEESEKAAAELGAFTERGAYDMLRKLGSERHDDEMHYLMPFVEQKVAEAGAHAALKKFASKKDAFMAAVRGGADKVKDVAGKAVSKAKDAAKAAPTKAKELGHRAASAANPVSNFRNAAKGSVSATGAHGGKRDFALGGKGRAMEAAKGTGKVGLFGLAAYGGGKAVAGKKDDAK